MRKQLEIVLAAAILVVAAAMPTAWAAGNDMQSRLEKAVHAYYYGSREEALPLLRPLAEAGCAKAQAKLSGLYDQPREHGGDPEKTLRWMQLAAENGNAEAQFYMGVSYDFGTLGHASRDFEKALVWYRRAAEQGEPRAMRELSRMYLAGHGVQPNQVEALKWLLLAVPRYPPPTERPAYGAGFDTTGRTEATAYRARLADYLSTKVVTDAERKAKAWEKAHNYIHRMPKTSDKPLPLWHDRIGGGCED